jgi:regulator of sirC expression with transglutaminase-like and TPR domain
MQTAKAALLDCIRNNNLLEGSLLVGQIQDSAFETQSYVDQLEHSIEQARVRADKSKEDPFAVVEAINHVIFKVLGIEGKSEKYKQVIDDPNRYYLHLVLEKQIASPLCMAVIYSVFAEGLGLSYECLALPSYYLMRIHSEGMDFYVDVFDQGKLLSQEEFQKKFRSALHKSRMLSASLFEKVNSTQLISRLVQQLKHIYILRSQAVEALRAVEILTSLFPENPEFTRDRGILYCEMEYFSKAMDDLKHYLEVRPQAEDVHEIKKLTQMLKGYREILN